MKMRVTTNLECGCVLTHEEDYRVRAPIVGDVRECVNHGEQEIVKWTRISK